MTRFGRVPLQLWPVGTAAIAAGFVLPLEGDEPVRAVAAITPRLDSDLAHTSAEVMASWWLPASAALVLGLPTGRLSTG